MLCAPLSSTSDAQIENIKDVVKYVMKWPERVDKNLGKNKEVNTYVGRLYNQGDWAKVKGKSKRMSLLSTCLTLLLQMSSTASGK